MSGSTYKHIKQRTIPAIDLSNFEKRRDEIKKQLFDAAINDGFFSLYGQDSPSKAEILEMFELEKQFFAQPMQTKMKIKHEKIKNTGYEYLTQVRPSTGTPDQKESLQLQYHRFNDNWPKDLGEQWNLKVKDLMIKCQELSVKILELFAESLGFQSDFFSKAHNIQQETAQSTLRLLHYFARDESQKYDPKLWRAGPHTDFDCLTLLFCRDGDHGLEVCPGRETHTDFGYGDEWTPVPSVTGNIVVNIGDMLMYWSDDKLKSTFHRVRLPFPEENQGDRYTFVWFNQANSDVIIQGKEKKYPPMTGKEFIENAMRLNFERIEKKRKEIEA